MIFLTFKKKEYLVIFSGDLRETAPGQRTNGVMASLTYTFIHLPFINFLLHLLLLYSCYFKLFIATKKSHPCGWLFTMKKQLKFISEYSAVPARTLFYGLPFSEEMKKEWQESRNRQRSTWGWYNCIA